MGLLLVTHWVGPMRDLPNQTPHNKPKAVYMILGDGLDVLAAVFFLMMKSLRKASTATTPNSYCVSVGLCRKVKRGGNTLHRWSYPFGPFMNVVVEEQLKELWSHGWTVSCHGVLTGSRRM